MHTHLTPSQMNELLGSEHVRGLSDAARKRLEWIARFVQGGSSVSEVCTEFGIARSTFHRWLRRFNPHDLQTLEERSHEPHALRSAAVSEEVMERIRSCRRADAYMGKEQIRALLKTQYEMDVSSSTIGRVIERECLYFGSSPLHWRKRNRRTQQTTSAAAFVPATQKQAGHGWKHIKRTALLAGAAMQIAVIAAMVALSTFEYRHRISADLTQKPTTMITTNSTLDGEPSALEP